MTLTPPALSVPFVRELSPGMGQAVAERTILRKKPDGTRETWSDVAYRVALGNSLLCANTEEQAQEFFMLERHLAKATILMSGRHLQHGDADQPTRPGEVFTNCSTAATSFLTFYLLLNGSGVGRSYDDDMMLVNWDNAPVVRCVLSEQHADFDYTSHESKRDALHKWGTGESVVWHEVDDSREGWAKALELWETMAFEKVHKDKLLVLDFSPVRKKGSPIGGMQNRPASGPVPLMGAFAKAATIRNAGMKPWKQAMYVDHYFAECVLVGGARRAARIATKHWLDSSILDFIQVKRPIEFIGKTVTEVAEQRALGRFEPFLWSSNNSVVVDDEFWAALDNDSHANAAKAHSVFDMITACAYGDGTGEPGIINGHKLQQNDEGWGNLSRGDFVGSDRYQVDDETQLYLSRLAKKAKKKKLHTIVNPCSEISLNLLGAYCTIADAVPFHADTIEEAIEGMCAAARALVRVNTMDFLFSKEVKRTNRIGVGLTGIHEFAWKFFGVGFRDLIKPDFDALDHGARSVDSTLPAPAGARAAAFWRTLARMSNAVREDVRAYCKRLDVSYPHTVTTAKPAGTTSKLFLLTEGVHLPSHREFLRNVQFRSDDPLVQTYRDAGYPVRDLKTYGGTSIVGFPTAPTITTIGMSDALVTAPEATPEEQFEWLRLLELHWINGGDPNATDGNQVSYTLKYSPASVTFEDFKAMMRTNMQTVRCCSVLPIEDTSIYEYSPEQGVTKGEYDAILRGINSTHSEDVALEHVQCSAGGCPIDFTEGDKEEEEEVAL